jgi:hypothetical protein
MMLRTVRAVRAVKLGARAVVPFGAMSLPLQPRRLLSPPLLRLKNSIMLLLKQLLKEKDTKPIANVPDAGRKVRWSILHKMATTSISFV